jgi:hypothetical protein
MLIIGAGGFAKKYWKFLPEKINCRNLHFMMTLILIWCNFRRVPILKHEDKAKKHFHDFSNEFVLGIDNPLNRLRLSGKFEK